MAIQAIKMFPEMVTVKYNFDGVSTDAWKTGKQHMFWKCAGKTGKSYAFLIVMLKKWENQKSSKFIFLC